MSRRTVLAGANRKAFEVAGIAEDVPNPPGAAFVRAHSAEKAGIGYSLHSDFMVTGPNPLHMIKMAATRRTWQDPRLFSA